MASNVGTIDRLIRFAIAGVLLYLGLGVYGGTNLGTGLAIAALLPAATGLIGFCGLYRLLGINTANRQSQT
jgi:hypothetical protein